jgi:hypothetical protein
MSLQSLKVHKLDCTVEFQIVSTTMLKKACFHSERTVTGDIFTIVL